MTDELANRMEQLGEWWRGLPEEARTGLTVAGVLLATVVGAAVVRRVVRGRLRAVGLDDYLRPPWGLPAEKGAAAEVRLSPSGALGLLAGLSVWLVVACVAARQSNDWQSAGRTLESVLAVLWKLAFVVVAALWVARLVAGPVIQLVQASTARESLEAWLGGRGGGRDGRPAPVAAAVGATVYGVVLLLGLMVGAEVLGWASVAEALAAVWQLGLRLLTAGAAFLLAWLGYQWVAAVTPPRDEADRVRWYLQLGLVCAATLGAVVLLSSDLRSLVVLAVLVAVVLLVWPWRSTFPDLVAGAYLRSSGEKSARMNGTVCEVRRVGLLATELQHDGERLVRRNREVCRAVMAAAPGDRQGTAPEEAPPS